MSQMEMEHHKVSHSSNAIKHKTTYWLSVSEQLPTSGCSSYSGLLEVKNKCFYTYSKWM